MAPFTEYSLKVLHEISRDERLRKCMADLLLSFPASEYINVDRHCRRRHTVNLRCDANKKQLSFAGTSCLWDDLEDDEFDSEESCSIILEAALGNLKAAGIIPSMQATGWQPHINSDRGPYGLSTVQRQLRNIGVSTRCLRSSTDNLAVSRTLVAIARTEFPIIDLDISGSRPEPPSEPEAFASMASAQSFSCWTNLVKLDVTVHSSNMRSDLPKWTAFQTWLASLRALKDLEIAFEWPEPEGIRHWDEEGEDWAMMTRRSTWERLSECLKDTLSLSELTTGIGRFTRDGIICLLSSLATRLKGLRMIQSTIIGDLALWQHDVLPWVAENLHLERAHFLYIQNDRGEIRTHDDGHGFYIDGSKQDMREALLEQARSIRFTDDFASEQASDDGSDEVRALEDDEYGPDFDDSDLQVMDQLEPHD